MDKISTLGMERIIGIEAEIAEGLVQPARGVAVTRWFHNAAIFTVTRSSPARGLDCPCYVQWVPLLRWRVILDHMLDGFVHLFRREKDDGLELRRPAGVGHQRGGRDAHVVW